VVVAASGGHLHLYRRRLVGARLTGSMLWFHETKGYGFIRTEEGERLYVDRDGFRDGAAPVGRCAGLTVRLSVKERGGRRVAVDVALVIDDEPRRARRRGSSQRRGSS